MTYQKTLEYIHSLGKFGKVAGLERIKKALALLNNPQDSLKSIHIAGTNGKGSVSAMISSVFCEAGYKTGLFISPYIIDFRERIQINGEYISEKDICRYAQCVIKTQVELTEFEFITAMAFLYFKEQKIDILICETGLGGRFDATNTLDNLACAVITKIGLDHTAVLGDTIEKIAFEKCGILRDAPTITSPFQKPKALEVIKSIAKKLILPEILSANKIGKDETENTFIYKGEKYSVSLMGDYQIENAVIAIEAIKNSGYDIPYNILYNGLKNAFIPARMEKISEKPLIIVDGAHNPDGADVLAAELKKYSGDITAIIGMMKDKDCEEVLEKTLKYCKSAICVEVENQPRSLSSSELLKLSSKYTNSICAGNYADALNKAKELCGGSPVFIFGSLYLAADVRKILK